MPASIHQSITIKLNLFLERNNKVPVLDATYENIENSVLKEFDKNCKHLGDRKYLLTIRYAGDDNLGI